jgi:hypothetical protein
LALAVVTEAPVASAELAEQVDEMAPEVPVAVVESQEP